MAETAVGFVGLGTMGLPMARNLLSAGFHVTVWNRSPGPAMELAAAGATVAETPAALADVVPVVITMLPDTPELEEVLFRRDGLMTAARPGFLVVVMGTCSPVAVRDLATRLADRGVRLVDAPVSGGDVGAREGTLSVMAGGDPADYARALPFLLAMSGTVRRMGPVGAGQLTKACNQVVVAATLEAIGEALVLAEAGGLDPDAVTQVLAAGLAGSRALEVKREKLLSRDFRPGGMAAFQRKDLAFALAAARDLGVALPVTAVVDQLYAALCAMGRGGDDHSAILTVLEDLAGGSLEDR